MKLLVFVILLILIGIGFLGNACTREGSPRKPTKAGEVSTLYICPMHPEAGEFPHPGTCPICGMKLVPKSR